MLSDQLIAKLQASHAKTLAEKELADKLASEANIDKQQAIEAKLTATQEKIEAELAAAEAEQKYKFEEAARILAE